VAIGSLSLPQRAQDKKLPACSFDKNTSVLCIERTRSWKLSPADLDTCRDDGAFKTTKKSEREILLDSLMTRSFSSESD
jgi:hypothetical protein